MSTYDTAALWSATQLATDPTKIDAAGLSVRQRKLLTLLSQPMSVAQIASSIALPIEEVHATLDRFVKLGLAQSGESANKPFDPMQLRVTPGVNATASASSSRMPMMIGVAVAALALVAAAAWTLRGSSGSSATQAPNGSDATAAAPKTPIPTSAADAGDTANIVLTPRVSAPASNQLPSAAVALSASPANAVAAPLVPSAVTKAADNITTPAIAATAAAAATSTTPLLAGNPAAALSAAIPVTLAPAPTATVAPSAEATVLPGPAPVVAAPTAVATSTPTPTAVTTATPSRAAPATPREIKLVTRVEPQFPRGFDNNSGTVRARLQVDARGAVTGVDIVEANPPRVFDRSVRTALQQWRYEPTGEAFSTMAEISFSR